MAPKQRLTYFEKLVVSRGQIAGCARDDIVHNGVLENDVELIGKPFKFEELVAKVQAVLDAPVKASH